MASHSSILAWDISWTEEPGGLQPTGGKRVWHDLATKQTESKKKVSRKGWGHIKRI